MSDPRRALIVIDVQNEYVTGRLRVEYPEVHGSLARIGRAMDAAHATGIPIAVIQHHAMGAGASLFARGSAGWGCTKPSHAARTMCAWKRPSQAPWPERGLVHGCGRGPSTRSPSLDT